MKNEKYHTALNCLVILLLAGCTNLSNSPATSFTAIDNPVSDLIITAEVKDDFGRVCGDVTDIFFLYSGPTHNGAKDEALYVLSQSEEEAILVLDQVNDSFDWTRDGKKLAVSCTIGDSPKSICVFEFAVEQSCLYSEKATQYTIPEQCYGVSTQEKHDSLVKFRTISWSPNGESFVFLCRGITPNTQVCVMSLDGNVYCWEWEDEIVDVDWSTTTDDLIVADIDENLFIVSLTGEKVAYLTRGRFPSWSWDGTQIAFVKQFFSSDGESAGWGVATINSDGTNEQWVFKPFESPEHEKLLERFGLHWMGFVCYDLGDDCKISWSPNDQYLIFSTNVGNIYKVELVRLDLVSGQVAVLPETVCSPTCSSPVWRP
jgi:hypothetical protein